MKIQPLKVLDGKVEKVRKRDGRVVDFDQSKITSAIYKAMQVSQEGDLSKHPQKVSEKVVKALAKKLTKDQVPNIEKIQDVVEEMLILMDFPKTVKSYILYRHERASIRDKRKEVPQDIKELVKKSSKYFQSPFSEFIYYRTYSRWMEDEGRRETWVETVSRYVNFMKKKLGKKLSDEEYEKIKQAILNQETMPSMRLVWSAGKAVEASNVCAYNCSYIAPTKLRDFSDIMYILMCGTGLGFSVESRFVQQLPLIKPQTGKKLPVYIIKDSKEGWGDALTKGLETWYAGEDIEFDYSQLRPAGARLNTMGGRSSGPEPLKSLLIFARNKILEHQGKRLRNIDIHDIICKIGELVVMGGVRRCLPQDTLIHTENGLIPIKNIHRGSKVLTKSGKYAEVLAAEHTGKRKVVNINTQLGIFQSTPEHRWAVFSDLKGDIKWVKASDLTPKDRLIHIPKEIPGQKTVLPFYEYEKPKYSSTTKDIIIPELDQEIAWLIGYFHGDGYVYHKDDTYGEIMIVCSLDMPKTVKRIKKNLEKFGVNITVKEGKKDRVIKIKAKSNQLANYFYQFKKPKQSINVPDFILEGTSKIRAAYIAGVFDADGSVKSRKGKKVLPCIVSIYPDWLRQLRTVLASISISARVNLNRPAKGNWKAIFKLGTVSIEALYKFADYIGPYSEKWKNDATGLERRKEQNSFTVSKTLLGESEYRSYFNRAYYSTASKPLLSFSKLNQVLLANFAIEPKLYRPVKIKKVVYGGIKDTYDIQVKGDECFVAGGMLVHNSALISLSDLDDERMLNAKMGEFYIKNPQRSMANNSAAYTEKPSSTQFLEEWLGLMKGGSGERGIFNRGGLEKQTPPRRWKTLQNHIESAGTNPCGEIILRSKAFCNLTEVVARPEDTEESLLKKVRIATILGTFQSMLTDFHYISKDWRKNCEEERLLGVSITGQWDCPAVRDTEVLRKLKQRAIELNREYAKRFGIRESNAVTSVKPSGTVSQLVNSSSGMHPRYSPYYIRRVRIAASDPLFQMLKDQKFPYHPEVGQSEDSASTYVLEFPVKSPDNAVVRDDLNAIEQLEYWKKVKTEYTEHNPSQTILIGEDEWIEAAHWIYKNWDIVGGLSFLPRNNHVYKLSPYEEITKEKYEELSSKIPEIDFSQIVVYEKDDQTTGAKAPACESAVCELNPDLNNPEKKQ